MHFIKNHSHSLGFILLELVVGVLLLVNPIGFTSTIIIAAGALLLLGGIFFIVKYFRSTASSSLKDQRLTKGLFLLLFGWLCAFHSNWLMLFFPALTLMYGIGMLITSLSKIQLTVDLIRIRHNRWFVWAISAALSLGCAIVIICNPFLTAEVLWIFSGISLIVEAVADGVSFFFFQPKWKA